MVGKPLVRFDGLVHHVQQPRKHLKAAAAYPRTRDVRRNVLDLGNLRQIGPISLHEPRLKGRHRTPPPVLRQKSAKRFPSFLSGSSLRFSVAAGVTLSNENMEMSSFYKFD